MRRNRSSSVDLVALAYNLLVAALLLGGVWSYTADSAPAREARLPSPMSTPNGGGPSLADVDKRPNGVVLAASPEVPSVSLDVSPADPAPAGPPPASALDAAPPLDDPVDEEPEQRDDDKSVVICHVPSGHGQTKVIDRPALESHLNHGDTRGACPVDGEDDDKDDDRETSSSDRDRSNDRKDKKREPGHDREPNEEREKNHGDKGHGPPDKGGRGGGRGR